jgi:hypothetical protein
MANDEFDNAIADKAILEEMNAKFAAEREAKQADDPRERCRTGAICPLCKGSGLDPKLTRFEWDEFNPSGYWATEPCEECGGSGLSQGMNNAMDQLAAQGHELHELRKLLSGLTGKVEQWRSWIDESPEPDDASFKEKAEEILGGLNDEFIELQGQLFPEGQ